MNNLKSLGIIIPCYNEEGNIKECIKRIPKMPWDIELIVVNDGSQDRTIEVVQDIMNKREQTKHRRSTGACSKNR